MAHQLSATNLRLIRDAHKQRLDNARRVDSRTGEAIGAPFKLQSLGCYLAVNDAIDGQTDAERWFGLDRSYYLGLSDCGDTMDEGERFALVILDQIKTGGDPLRVKCPAAYVAPARAIAA